MSALDTVGTVKIDLPSGVSTANRLAHHTRFTDRLS
jgi:hypothetical protein